MFTASRPGRCWLSTDSPTPSPLASKCWTPGGHLETVISLRKANRDFPTGLPVGFHISGGSGAVEEIVGVIPRPSPTASGEELYEQWRREPGLCQRREGSLGVEGTVTLRKEHPGFVPSLDHVLWRHCQEASLPASEGQFPTGAAVAPLITRPSSHLMSIPPALPHFSRHVHFKSSHGATSSEPRGVARGQMRGGFSTMLSRGRGTPGWRGHAGCLASSEFLGLL